MKSHKELIVWQKAIDLVYEIYGITKEMPTSEQFGLVSQMRRASVSIPSNIAEGYSRQGLGEYIQFLSIAYGSASELETQIIISRKIYPKLNFSKIEVLLNEILKMLFTMISKLKFNR